MNGRVHVSLLSLGAGVAIGAVLAVTVGFGGPGLIAAVVTVVAAAAGLSRNSLS